MDGDKRDRGAVLDNGLKSIINQDHIQTLFHWQAFLDWVSTACNYSSTADWLLVRQCPMKDSLSWFQVNVFLHSKCSTRSNLSTSTRFIYPVQSQHDFAFWAHFKGSEERSIAFSVFSSLQCTVLCFVFHYIIKQCVFLQQLQCKYGFTILHIQLCYCTLKLPVYGTSGPIPGY